MRKRCECETPAMKKLQRKKIHQSRWEEQTGEFEAVQPVRLGDAGCSCDTGRNIGVSA